MDAFDIFKKLSRGAKFSKPLNPILTTKKSSEEKESIQIKQEKVDDDEDYPETKIELEPFEKGSSGVTLLSTLKTEPGKKKRKKGIENDNGESAKKKLIMLEKEKVNHYRNVNNITVVGKNIPDPAKTFEDFQIEEGLIKNLKNCGYTEPTIIQKQAIPILIQGRQLLACAPTGSGKTAAFLVPLIRHLNRPQKKGFRLLIICPTRELAKQTQRECLKLSEGRGLRIHIISKIKKALSQYGKRSSQKYDVLITTPNRLCFLLSQDPPGISLINIQWIVVDEADKLFEEGNRSFREQFDQILAACTNKEKKIAMFSATHTPTVAKWCVHNMKQLVRVTVGHRNAATDTVDQELLFVGNEDGKLIAFRDLVRKGLSPPVLIFVQSKERAQQLFNELIYDGINVDAIHADRTQLQRDNTVRSFREGKIWILICTELMARGIDFKGVNLVINYDFPPSAISYVHRIGRAGRAGRHGKAITFFTTEDTINLRSIAHVLKESGCDIPPYMLAMKKNNKRERKRLEKAAPKRANIKTKPIYEERKLQKWKRGRSEENRDLKIVKDKRKRDSSKKLNKISIKSKTIKRNKNVKKKV